MMLRSLTRPRNVLLLGVGVGTAYCIHQNDYSLSDIGVIRFMRVGITASKIAVDYKFTMRETEAEKYRIKMSNCHRRSAEKILDLCRSNGGVFIKVGQHIASLQYLLPEEYTSTLGVLHSNAPESNIEEIREVFRQSTGKNLDDVFTDFDCTPCGAASLAQVHKARLKSNNELVAIKIQHPKVKARSLVDIATMTFFVRIAHSLFPDFHLMWLVEETNKNLPKELDFLHEAENAETVRRLFKHLKFLHIPKIYHELSSEKVLTMEFCEGRQINDIEFFQENGIDTHKICKNLGRLYSEMIFKHGFIHADPHPGNVLVQQKGKKVKLILLDHGLYSKLDDEFRIDYVNLWMALMKPDKDELLRLCTKMGVGDLFGLFACIVTARSWKAVTEGITKVKPSLNERKEIKEFASTLIPQISQVLEKMPRSMLLILKTNDLLRAIEHRLQSHYRSDAFLEMAKCCNRAVYEHKIRQTSSTLKHVQASINLYWILFKINVYQLYLTCKDLIWGPKPSYLSKRRLLQKI